MLREFTRTDTVKTNTQEALAETNLPTEIQTTKDKLRGLKEMVDEGLIYLGYMYAKGEGVPANNVKAYMWLSLAKAQGDEMVADNLEIIKKQMTPAQIGEAQKLAAEWWEEHNN